MSEKNPLEGSNGESDETAVSRRSLLKTGAIFAGMVTSGSSVSEYLSQVVLGSRPDSESGTEPRVETNTLYVTADSTTIMNSNGVYERIVWEATGRLVVENGAGIKLSETV